MRGRTHPIYTRATDYSGVFQDKNITLNPKKLSVIFFSLKVFFLNKNIAASLFGNHQPVKVFECMGG